MGEVLLRRKSERVVRVWNFSFQPAAAVVVNKLQNKSINDLVKVDVKGRVPGKVLLFPALCARSLRQCKVRLFGDPTHARSA
jgi:hypothetical protein